MSRLVTRSRPRYPPAMKITSALWLWLCLALDSSGATSDPLQAQITRGKGLFIANCVICHQVTGLGIPGVFPPLAKSDFLQKQRDRAILAVLEGIEGPLTVNGKKFNGSMPPVNLDDEQVSDLFAFLLNSLGNSGGQVTVSEVKSLRAKSKFPTYQDLVRANSFAPLPPPPEGLALREAARLTEHGIRLVPDHAGEGLYVLGAAGNLHHLSPKTGALAQVLWGKNYLEQKGENTSTWGAALDSSNRLYIVANRRDDSGTLVTNFVTIYRTVSTLDGHPAEPKPWFQAAYPWGVGPFNHSVNQAAFGPDGFLYINSGSRTDGNEPGRDPHYWTGGEHPITACIWRLDPAQDSPKLEIYARGLRNAFGFCWNDHGEMFATENGPDANAPEELNLIEKGRHYGFPYQFSNWEKKPYPYTPEPPPGLVFTRPIPNTGPDAGYRGRPVYTFDPHSSPAGIVHLGKDFPEPYAGSFLIARVGNLLKTPVDVGFDVLQAKLSKDKSGHYQAQVRTLLPGLGRPVDLLANKHGQVYILEYSRPTNNAGALGFPGRVLELSAKQ